MKRLLLAAAAISAPLPAAAIPCAGPGITAGWSQSFYGTSLVNGFTYDQANLILYVSMIRGSFNDFFNVPAYVAMSFNNTRTPDTFYQQQIANSYHEALLTEACGFLQTEVGGYLLTK